LNFLEDDNRICGKKIYKKNMYLIYQIIYIIKKLKKYVFAFGAR